MNRIPYFQSDDIPQCEPKKDCINTHYKVYVSNELIKKGRFALKQTKALQGKRTVYKRLWNESKKEWKTDWILMEIN
jgi:hypothetical protein